MEHLEEKSEVMAWLVLIRHFRVWVIAVFIVVFIISFYVLGVKRYYSASATFSVNDWKEKVIDEKSAGQKVLANKDEVITLFFSDAAIDYLIQQFHLDADIKSGDSVEVNKLRMNIASAITIMPESFNAYELSLVSDDRYLCASMANALIQKVQILNMERDQEQLRRQIAFLDDLRAAENTKQTENGAAFEERVQKAADLISELGKNESREARNLQDELLGILNDLQTNYLELNQQKYSAEVVLNAVTNDQLPSITLIRKAIPDYHDFLIEDLAYSFLFGLLALLLLPVFLFLFLKYRFEWNDSMKPEETEITEVKELHSAKY